MYTAGIKGAKVLPCGDVATPPEVSPHHNAVVGRNGSGKTNLFDAIRFVLLADKFKTLQESGRTEPLPEGRGVQGARAHVELASGNESRRLPYDKPEVTLTRTVALEEDEFFVNGKKATKEGVISMFESAGFSRPNPYCIVRQGKVQELVGMSSAKRLGVIKEVAGTEVCEKEQGPQDGHHGRRRSHLLL